MTSCTSVFLSLKMSLSHSLPAPSVCVEVLGKVHTGWDLVAGKVHMGWDLVTGKASSPLPSPEQKQLLWSESPKWDTNSRQGQPASPHPWKDTELFLWCR